MSWSSLFYLMVIMISDGNVCRLSDECIYSDIVIFTLGDNVYTVALNSAYSDDRL